MENRYEQILTHENKIVKKRGLQLLLVFVIVIFASFWTDLLNFNRHVEGIPDFLSLLGEMFPPDFTLLSSWLFPVIDTLMMSIAGTAIAVVISFFIAFFASGLTTPHPTIYHISRMVLNLFRAIPELIMGIIFVAAVGFGALPGVLALGFHSIGMVGKFFAEAVEHVDKEPIEAIKAAGGTRFQVIVHGIIPQIIPQIVDVTIYRWEYNFRASTVMGAVGAGGIGFQLIASLRVLKYQEVSAIIIVILILVTLVDSFGALLRKNFK